MPIKKGSCLNEEYTETIKQIYSLLKEAKKKYESLPKSIKCVQTKHEELGGKSLYYYLINGKKSVWCFAEEFGIEIVDNE